MNAMKNRTIGTKGSKRNSAAVIRAAMEPLEERRLLSVGPISLGQVQSGSLAAAQINDYTFTGTAGEIVRVVVANTSNTNFYDFLPYADLTAPGGATLASVAYGTEKQFTLGTTGTYVIKVHDLNYTDTGNYTIALQGINPLDPGIKTLAPGIVQSGIMTTGAQVDEYRFVASANQIVRFAVANTSNTNFYDWVPSVYLNSASGASLATFTIGTQTQYKFASAGTYIIEVHDGNFTDTGSYTFGIKGINPVDPGTLWAFPDTPTSGTFTIGAQDDTYAFYANANDTINLLMANTSNTNFYDWVPSADILTSSGSLVGTVASGGNSNFKITTAGNYVISIHDTNFTDVGSYSFTLSWNNPLDGSISGNVFNDANGNGKKDTGEVGLAGETVYLDTNNDGILDDGERSEVTDSLGNYVFSGLAPGATYVVREVVPTGMKLTNPTAGYYSVPISYLDDVTGKNFGDEVSALTSIVVTPPAAQSATVGVSKSFALGSFTQSNATAPFTATVNWGDGSTNSSIPIAAAGTIPATAHTYASSGSKTVTITVTDSASHSSKSVTFSVTVAAAVSTGTITGVVFSDTNGNGTQDPGEKGLAGITVYIDAKKTGTYVSTDTSTVTNSSGDFTLSNVPAGSYEIREEMVPTGYREIVPTAGYFSVTVVGGKTASGYNFADAPDTASISGEVFNDANGDGKLDGGEAGMGLFTVTLTYVSGPLSGHTATAVTNIFGDWSFTGLIAGKYTVKVAAVTGLKVTTPVGDLLTLTLANGQLSANHLFGEEAIA